MLCIGLGKWQIIQFHSQVVGIGSIIISSPPEQMAAISQTIFSDAFYILISLKCVSKGPIDNNQALV